MELLERLMELLERIMELLERLMELLEGLMELLERRMELSERCGGLVSESDARPEGRQFESRPIRDVQGRAQGAGRRAQRPWKYA